MGPPVNLVMIYPVRCAGDWHCHECRTAKKAAAKGPKPATSTEAVLSEPEAEPKTAAKPARRSAPASVISCRGQYYETGNHALYA